MYHYKTHGTCSSEIELEIQNGIITHCKFIGGCKGIVARLPPDAPEQERAAEHQHEQEAAADEHQRAIPTIAAGTLSTGPGERQRCGEVDTVA